MYISLDNTASESKPAVKVAQDTAVIAQHPQIQSDSVLGLITEVPLGPYADRGYTPSEMEPPESADSEIAYFVPPSLDVTTPQDPPLQKDIQ